MLNTPIQPQQARAEKTRQKLIDAAIECLAKYGYAGTELGQICDVAKVSRRSRQYYFPSRVDLMMSVWQEIRRRDDVIFKTFQESKKLGLHATVELILESGFKKYKTTQYLADLELKLALRSDKELEKVLKPQMEQREVDTDELWITLFEDLGKTRSEIITIRHLHVGLLRGIIYEYLTRVDRSLLPDLEQQIKTIIHSLLI
ncbi:TetR/AcrR family transcriptional regulator [Agarilytica rhodophyticola]|uniref:TetR/AcrR family transcriptional regulator n=1 Tax=Agarilytica rhodophyticola TaxID=1737490 RepID=UPI000B3414EE|nr:TetR/AcrR family transcriptional regulator [Agarilytica rhodophyticola]